MKTFVPSKNIVNFKLQTFLFAFAILMHVVATFVEASHPLFGVFFTLLETLGWLCILLTWVFALITGIQQWGPILWTYARTHGRKLWTMGWRYVSTHGRIKKAKKANDPFVSVEQLKHLKNNIDRLGLALHGMTPEMESARRMSFQTRGEAIPTLILPPQNASLYAEFTSLTRFLTHVGFPNLESVRLRQKDAEFARQWGRDLEARLLQLQKHRKDQQHTLDAALMQASQVYESIGEMYPEALNDAGYHRMRGALLVLEAMAGNSAIPCALVQSYLPALQRDMDTFLKQLNQPAA